MVLVFHGVAEGGYVGFEGFEGAGAGGFDDADGFFRVCVFGGWCDAGVSCKLLGITT